MPFNDGPATPGARSRVLIVEDDALLAWEMALDLETAGFQVCGVVASGPAALEGIVAGPAVVLMDVDLKGELDGTETVRRLRAQGHKTPVVFVTGFADPETKARIQALSGSAHLLKPVRPEELVAAVQRALAEDSDGSA